ncbi:hypothetical protein XENOCAPTIV_023268 [Xenoophorus captivus]|uniref:Uncharacterized protein n=1 Tax=Xenoophorus captivus TaxID=1517983 RepID=A0ABV0QT86_9TELE
MMCLKTQQWPNKSGPLTALSVGVTAGPGLYSCHNLEQRPLSCVGVNATIINIVNEMSQNSPSDVMVLIGCLFDLCRGLIFLSLSFGLSAASLLSADFRGEGEWNVKYLSEYETGDAVLLEEGFFNGTSVTCNGCAFKASRF